MSSQSSFLSSFLAQTRRVSDVVLWRLVGRFFGLLLKFFRSVAYIFTSKPNSPWYEPVFGLLLLLLGLTAVARIVWRLANW